MIQDLRRVRLHRHAYAKRLEGDLVPATVPSRVAHTPMIEAGAGRESGLTTLGRVFRVGSVVLGVRVLLSVVFATAGVAKLLDRQGTREGLQGFGVPGLAVPATAVLLPLAELATAVALVAEASAQWGGVAAVLLLLAFIAGIANALARGQAPDCHCFGQIHSEPAGGGTLARNVALAALAALVVVEGPGPSLTGWVSDRTAAELVAVAAGLAAAILGRLAIRFWRENQGLRSDLKNAQAEIASLPAGLPVGALAPGFALPSVQGETVTLEALRARGRPVVLVFVEPGCGPCGPLFPKLARWQAAMSSDLTVGLVSSGTPEENRLAVQDGGAEVLLQEDFEVATAYRIRATPATVIVTPQGRIAGAPAFGSPAIESLLRLTLRRQVEGSEVASPHPVA